MVLRKDVRSPFPPESDEVTVNKQAEKPAEGTPTEQPKPPEARPEALPRPPANLVVDFDGITTRVARVPVGADNYGGRAAKAGHPPYFVGPAFYYGRHGDRPGPLRLFSFKNRKE